MKRAINVKKAIVIALAAAGATLALQHVGTDPFNPARIAVDVRGFNSAFAGEDDWSGVRGVATLVRGANRALNSIFNTLRAAGVFNYTISYDGAVPGTSWTVSIRTNDPRSFQGTVDASAVTYNSRVRVQVAGNDALQLFFDSVSSSDIGNGCLMIVKPWYFEAVPGTVYSSTAVFEARVKKSGENTVMYISMNGNPWKTGTPTYVKSARVKLTDDGTNYNIGCMASVHVDGSDVYHSICPIGTGAGDAFYSLAYVVRKGGVNQSTAMWGWNNSAKSNQICGVANPRNYGCFNSQSPYFVGDGVTTPGTGYPATAEVDAVYTSMDTGSVNEFNAAAISGLNIAFKTWP